MIVTEDGYSAEYYRKNNQIVIGLPQMAETITNTVAIVRNRKDIDEDDLITLIELARYICER